MELHKPLSGVYKITNIKTGKIYIGESVNVVVRIATHFSQLQKDTHTNLELQHDYDVYGSDSFTYELVEECNSEKATLRALETQHIESRLKRGASLYNGGNDGFLHVKQRRKGRKNEQRAKRRLSEENQRDVSGYSKLFGTGTNLESESGNDMASNQSKQDASIINSSDGTERINGKSTTKRPTSEGVDENRQLGESYRNNLPPLPPGRHRDKADTRPLEDYYLFCDGFLDLHGEPLYCNCKCGRHLIIPLDDYEEIRYALYTYLSEEYRLKLADDLKKHWVFFDLTDIEEEKRELFEEMMNEHHAKTITSILNQRLDDWLATLPDGHKYFPQP